MTLRLAIYSQLTKSSTTKCQIPIFGTDELFRTLSSSSFPKNTELMTLVVIPFFLANKTNITRPETDTFVCK